MSHQWWAIENKTAFFVSLFFLRHHQHHLLHWFHRIHVPFVSILLWFSSSNSMNKYILILFRWSRRILWVLCVWSSFLLIATYLVITRDWIDETYYCMAWMSSNAHTFFHSAHGIFIASHLDNQRESPIGWDECNAHYVTFHFENMLFDCFDASIYFQHFIQKKNMKTDQWKQNRIEQSHVPVEVNECSYLISKWYRWTGFLWSHKSLHTEMQTRCVRSVFGN